MPSNIIDLHPDRSLLNPDFQGFKLILETPPVIKQKLTLKPHIVCPNTDQYSLLHATLFGFHNHLFSDPWDASTSYFINETWSVTKVSYNVDSGRMKSVVEVWKIPDNEKVDNCYNTTLKLISKDYAIVNDGNRNIHFVETGDRLSNVKWTILFSKRCETTSVITDARLEQFQDKKRVHCLLLQIERGEKHFENVLDWMIITMHEGATYSAIKIRQLRGHGTLYYCALEPGLQGLVMASDHRFKFIEDAENPFNIKEPISCNNSKDDVNEISELNNVAIEDENNHIRWSQVDDEIFFVLSSKTELKKLNVNVRDSSNTLKIEYDNDIMFDETLFGKISCDLTTWTLEGNSMNVTIFKTSAEPWPRLTKDYNKKYVEAEDPAIITQIRGTLDQICSNQSDGSTVRIQEDVDDCDFDIDSDIKETALERLCIQDHKSTHFINLGSTAPLFCARNLTNPDALPIIAIKHDVDGIVWQMPSCASNWPPQHLATLPAFAYVQASKLQRRFSSCAPDFSYAVICDATKHVFLYWATSGGQLFNRNNKKFVEHGQQKVIALEGLGEVVGLHAQNETLILLTKHNIVALQLKTSEF